MLEGLEVCGWNNQFWKRKEQNRKKSSKKHVLCLWKKVKGISVHLDISIQHSFIIKFRNV